MAARRAAPRGPVDWADIRRRVEAADRRLLEATEVSSERARDVLEERARALARPVVAPPAGEMVELITFALAREMYAIESRFVLEVFRLRELSPLPGAEPPVFGVTARRGELLTILDLRGPLGLPVTGLNDLGWVIALGEEGAAFGVLADGVQEIITLAAADVRPPPEGVAAKREYLRGITNKAVLVLEARRLLHPGEPPSR